MMMITVRLASRKMTKAVRVFSKTVLKAANTVGDPWLTETGGLGWAKKSPAGGSRQGVLQV